MPDRDTHYWKYRVFHEPTDDQVPDIELIGHPVPVKASYLAEEDAEIEVWSQLDEVEGSFYVLRPENDHHARVAIAAYAYSCKPDFPQLASDLLMMIEELREDDDDTVPPDGGLRIVK